MDFWSRLVGGAAVIPARKLASNNSQQRLTRFKKIYHLLLQAWNKLPNSTKSSRGLAEETLKEQLGRLTSLLYDDTRASVPHLCLAFASSHQVYSTLGNIAVSARNEQISLQSVAFFSTLVDNDEEHVLRDLAFSETLMTFVDHLVALSSTGSEINVLGEALEVLFGVAAQIRLEPEILPAWFHSQPVVASKHTEAAPIRNSREDFPLCHLLVGYVYSEGRIGDFARTGLLYIFESASSFSELETWIVQSDLPTLMASGLGALYSQLSRKLTLAHGSTKMPLILALSDLPERQPSATTESFHSADLQARLSTFLSYLHFWQDVLDYCRSTDIKVTLISHFRIFFLEQILYPSLLESSDIDGGSSVAVQTYLWRILDAVKHPDLITLILNYLLGASDSEGKTYTPTQVSLVNTEKRILQSATPLDTSSSLLDPSFFNLTDLILANVTSVNPETQSAALRTVSVLLTKHHHHTSNNLFTITHAKFSGEELRLGCHQQNVCNMLEMAKSLSFSQALDDAYEACLRDALASIENHICYGGGESDDRRLRPLTTWKDELLKQHPSQLRTNTLNPSDPLLRALCKLLDSFLQNEIEVNLGLTNVFTQLLSCPWLRLDGILTTKSVIDENGKYLDGPSQHKSLSGILLREEENRELLRLEAYKTSRLGMDQASSPGDSNADVCETPLLLAILNQLIRRVESIWEAEPDLAEFLASRKRALLGSIEAERLPPRATPVQLARSFGDNTQQRPTAPFRPSQSRPDGLLTAARPPSRGSSPAAHGHGEDLQQNLDFRHSRRGSGDPSISILKRQRQRQLSPLKSSHDPGSQELDGETPLRPNASKILETQVRFNDSNEPDMSFRRFKVQVETSPGELEEPNHEDPEDGGNDARTSIRQRDSTTSLHQILTNIVILQEFILELAALVHTRASLLESETPLA